MTPNANSFNASPLAAQMQQAWEQVNTGNSDTAAQLFRGAIGLAESEFGSDTLETAQVYTDVSTGLFLLGEQNYEEAANLLDRALHIQTAVEGECNLGCARLHRQLASMHNSRKDYEKAVASLQKAVDIFEALEVFGSEDIDAEEKDALYKDLRKTLLRADEQKETPEGVEPATKRLLNCDGRD
ncbi:MAG TPA: tetratricopeptide repeat protein [Oculatellaceae cyanobacterium]